MKSTALTRLHQSIVHWTVQKLHHNVTNVSLLITVLSDIWLQSITLESSSYRMQLKQITEWHAVNIVVSFTICYKISALFTTTSSACLTNITFPHNTVDVQKELARFTEGWCIHTVLVLTAVEQDIERINKTTKLGHLPRPWILRTENIEQCLRQPCWRFIEHLEVNVNTCWQLHVQFIHSTVMMTQSTSQHIQS